MIVLDESGSEGRVKGRPCVSTCAMEAQGRYRCSMIIVTAGRSNTPSSIKSVHVQKQMMSEKELGCTLSAKMM